MSDLVIQILLAASLLAVMVVLVILRGVQKEMRGLRRAMQDLTTSPIVQGPSQADISRAVRQEMARHQRQLDKIASELATLSSKSAKPAQPEDEALAKRGPAKVVARITEQPGLPLESPLSEAKTLDDWETVLTALNFPKDDNDETGFAALRLALQDPALSKLLRAAEDTLNLLAQLGIYMDDMRSAPIPTEFWKMRAEGKKVPPPSRLDGVKAPLAQATVEREIARDPILRDTVLHFIRRFDRLLSEMNDKAPEKTLTRLSDTRSGRAFLLFTRAFSASD